MISGVPSSAPAVRQAWVIARQAAFFSCTGIKIKLRHLTCDVKLEIVIAAKGSG